MLCGVVSLIAKLWILSGGVMFVGRRDGARTMNDHERALALDSCRLAGNMLLNTSLEGWPRGYWARAGPEAVDCAI